MPIRTIGIVIDGATGRLGATQHLKALLAIRGEGGLPLANGDRLMPQPVLLGRNAEKLAALAAASGGLTCSTDREACLADKAIGIYFDATATGGRPERLSTAFAAGKHVYTEKPVAETLEQALALAREAKRAGVKNGVVQDNCFCRVSRSSGSSTTAAISAACCRCGSILAGGCSTANSRPRNDRAGTTSARPGAG